MQERSWPLLGRRLELVVPGHKKLPRKRGQGATGGVYILCTYQLPWDTSQLRAILSYKVLISFFLCRFSLNLNHGGVDGPAHHSEATSMFLYQMNRWHGHAILRTVFAGCHDYGQIRPGSVEGPFCNIPSRRISRFSPGCRQALARHCGRSTRTSP